MFRWAAPEEILKAIMIHCTSFHGSSLWDLEGEKAMQVYRAWNTCLKAVWCCPPWTRTYLVQQVLCCGQTSAKVGIMGRFVTFFHSLRNSASREVQILSRLFARDIRSTCGRNLQYIREVTGLDPWTAPLGRLKAALAAQETVEVDAQDR